jgi:hypothetical protein
MSRLLQYTRKMIHCLRAVMSPWRPGIVTVAILWFLGGGMVGQPDQRAPTAAEGDSRGLAINKREYERYALTHAGDPDRGRILFADEQKLKCLLCHKVAGKGGEIGPDLSHIAGKFDRPHLVESLLDPSRQIVEGFRVSRFTAAGDRAEDGSERVLLEGDDQTKLGGSVPAGHQGGALHFGVDGKLYIAIGEQTAETPAQSLTTFQGKILRICADGTIPSDNPFADRTSGKYRAIWAMGLRNPFTFAVRKSNGELWINDVGGKFEEINVGVAGMNFGWPAVEHGPTADQRFRGPFYFYPQSSIAGGDFAPADWPNDFGGRYFFADFVHGWVKSLNPDHADEVRIFAEGLRRPVDLRFAPDGSLYLLLRNAWVVDDRFEPGTGALLRIYRSLRP